MDGVLPHRALKDSDIDSALALWPASVRVDDDRRTSGGVVEYRGRRLSDLRQSVVAGLPDDVTTLQLAGIVYSLLFDSAVLAFSSRARNVDRASVDRDSVRSASIEDFESAFGAARSLWPESISVDDAQPRSGGGAYFPGLSDAWNAAHSAAAGQEPITMLAWLVFRVLHRRGMALIAAGGIVRPPEVTVFDVLREYTLPLNV
jgi:hypothetical protein